MRQTKTVGHLPQTVWAAWRTHHNLLPHDFLIIHEWALWLWWWGSLDIKIGLLESSAAARCWHAFPLPLTLPPRLHPSRSARRHGSSRGRLRVEENHGKHPGRVWVRGGAGIVSTAYSLVCFWVVWCKRSRRVRKIHCVHCVKKHSWMSKCKFF